MDGQNQGARKSAGHAHAQPCDVAISFIRTVTVSPGFAPDLLTPASPCGGARRSRAVAQTRKYRRWGISPRPENAANRRRLATPSYAKPLSSPVAVATNQYSLAYPRDADAINTWPLAQVRRPLHHCAGARRLPCPSQRSSHSAALRRRVLASQRHMRARRLLKSRL